MRLAIILFLATLVLAAPLASSAGEPPILTGMSDPAQAVAAPGQAFSLKLVLSIAPKLHINGPSAQDDGLIPTRLSLGAPQGISLDQPVFPPAQPVRVKFAPKPVRVYGGKVEIAISGRVAATVKPGIYVITASLSYQACDDVVCHMPATLDIPLRIKVAAKP